MVNEKLRALYTRGKAMLAKEPAPHDERIAFLRSRVKALEGLLEDTKRRLALAIAYRE